MTQVQVDASFSSQLHLQRPMQNANDGSHPSASPHNPRPQATSLSAREGDSSSLGHLLRNNSLPDYVPTINSGAAQNGDLRRASAFQAPQPNSRDPEFSFTRLGQPRRVNDGGNEAQKAGLRPWNSDSPTEGRSTTESTRREGFTGFGFSSLTSPNEVQSFRRGSTAFWNASTPSSSNNGQNTPTSRPSLSGQSSDGSNRVAELDSLHNSGKRAVLGGPGYLSSGSASKRVLPALTPASSQEAYATHGNASFTPAALEDRMQQLHLNNGAANAGALANGNFDGPVGEPNYARMARTGSSPGHSSLSSDLGWNGTLPGRAAAEPYANSTLSGDRQSTLRARPSEYENNLGSTSSFGQGIRLPSSQMSVNQLRYNGSTDQMFPFGMDGSHTGMGTSLKLHPDLPDFRPIDTGNNGFDLAPYHANNVALGNRHSSNSRRDLANQSRLLNVQCDMSTTHPNFMGPRYFQSWPGSSHSVPPSPSGPPLGEQDPSKIWRSPLMEEFRMSNRSARRWGLKDVYGHIVEFAGDQHGSRFLQDKLKTANSEEKDRVFQEIHPNAVQLMKDVFGNYVLQKFFEHGDQIQKAALVDKMKGHVFALSTQTYACRVVQKALAHILVGQQVDLMQELDGRVMDCIKCENGNHVIQVAIEQVPLEHIPFMVDAIQRDIQYLSMHKYGCRVIQRMLEHAKDDTLSWLIPELHKCCGMLIADQFGNYVPAHIVEKGKPEDRNKVITVVQSNLLQFSKQKFASHVVEKCIRFGTDHHRRDFMHQLSSPNSRGETELEQLIRDGFANYVIQSLLETLHYDDYIYFCAMLQPALDKARLPSPNKQAENVARRMHRFDRAPIYPIQTRFFNGPTWNNSQFVKSM